MDEPDVPQYKPYRTEVEAGETYSWCSCGLSRTQPFCDQSHVGSRFRPVAFIAPKSGTVLFCGCKHSASGALCDGSHNNLVDEYAEDERPLAQLLDATDEIAFDRRGRAELDGGCYVQQPAGLNWKPVAGMDLATVISTADSARFLAQYMARLTEGRSRVMCFAEADVVVFCTAGAGRINVAGREFQLAPRVGIQVRREEGFQLICDSGEGLQCLLTVCPGTVELAVLDVMPDNFDSHFSERSVAYDESKKVSMADRFYQVLVGEEMGSTEVTQFIGQIPRSKAAPHRHLYEEAIVILSARGMMWTETRRAPVTAGDLIFLPAELEHSLQCTEEGGMELAGHFYPAGSPSINY